MSFLTQVPHSEGHMLSRPSFQTLGNLESWEKSQLSCSLLLREDNPHPFSCLPNGIMTNLYPVVTRPGDLTFPLIFW